MTDISALVFSAELTLLDISKQTFALASALQNAAPGDEAKEPNKSVVYLFTVSEKMEGLWGDCKKLSSESFIDQADKLVVYINEAVAADKMLREKYEVKDKFRFIRDRLKAIHEQVEKEVVEFKKVHVKKESVTEEDEIVVFVYLFNAQGAQVETWRKMVNPSVLYEYSVNRPIYTEKKHIETYIDHKTNKLQHAYLSVRIKKEDILKKDAALKDMYENPVIKIREGSLKADEIVVFTHNGVEFEVSEDGVMTNKLN